MAGRLLRWLGGAVLASLTVVWLLSWPGLALYGIVQQQSVYTPPAFRTPDSYPTYTPWVIPALPPPTPTWTALPRQTATPAWTRLPGAAQGGWWRATKGPTPTPYATIVPMPTAGGLTLDALSNASYDVGYGLARLVDGEYFMPTEVSPTSGFFAYEMTNFVAYGDVNGDEIEEAALILDATGGGSGYFSNLVVMVDRGGNPVQAGWTWLGDRVIVESLNIGDGGISVRMVTQGPNDPLCCPKLEVVRIFRLVGYELVELPGGEPLVPQLATATASPTVVPPPDGGGDGVPYALAGTS